MVPAKIQDTKNLIPDTNLPSKNLHITGHVQGVWFRASAKEKADELGIKGWAQNCGDGSVEIHAEGTPNALEEFEVWCSKGPPGATVHSVQSCDIPEEHPTSFTIRR